MLTLTALNNSLCALLALKLCILTCILIDMMYYISWIIICIYSFICVVVISYSVSVVYYNISICWGAVIYIHIF